MPNRRPLTRFQVYEPWRVAAEAVLGIRAAIRGTPTQGDLRASLRQLAAQLPVIAPSLPDEARANADTLVALLNVGLPPFEQALLQGVWAVFEPLGRLMMEPEDVSFRGDELPLAVEKRLLLKAFEIQESAGMGNGPGLSVVELARQARIDLTTVRRMVCAWLDDDCVYLPGTLKSADEEECFVLAEGVEARRDNWSSYAEERTSARRTRIAVPFAEQLPHGWVECARGAAVALGCDCEDVVPTTTGLIAIVVMPEGASKDECTTHFVRDVQKMLSDQRLQAPVHAPVSATYIAGTVGAQGPGAVATDNEFIQSGASAVWTPDYQQALADELAALRKSIVGLPEPLRDATEVLQYAVLAETAARSGDRTKMIGALMLIGASLPELARGFRLERLEREARLQLAR